MKRPADDRRPQGIRKYESGAARAEHSKNWRARDDFDTVKTMRMFARIPWLLLALLLVGVALCLRPVSDTDILWHLRAGQWMLAHGDVIRTDVFSATRWGCTWISVPWLHEVVLAWLHHTCGWLGPTLWQMAFVLVIAVQTSFLVCLFHRRSAGRWDWRWPHLSVSAVLAVLLTLRLLQMRINHRPEMNTYLLIGTFLIILSVAARSTRAARLLWLLPLLQIWWASTHGVFILGPLLIGAYAAAAWLTWGVGDGTPGGRRAVGAGRFLFGALQLTLAFLLTALACFVTPYGGAGACYPLHLFQVLNDPLYRDTIMEARPVSLSMAAAGSGSLGYALLACGVLAGLGLLGRLLDGWTGAEFRVQGSGVLTRSLTTDHRSLITSLAGLWQVATQELGLGYLVCCAALAYLSLTAIRNVPLLALAVAPLVANGIEYIADGLAAVAGGVWARVTRKPAPAGAVAGVACLHSRAGRIVARVAVLLVLILFYRAIVSERFYASLGWRTRCAVGFSDHEHPLAACRFLAKHLDVLGAQVVCGDTRSANTLLWRFGPRWLTYFDGRHAEIYDPPIFRAATATRTDAQAFAREARIYGIGLVCFALVDQPERAHPLARALFADSNTWGLVYLDDSAAVFVSRAHAPPAWVDRLALPQPPTNAVEQRTVFKTWLAVQGRAGIEELDDPANEALTTNAWARGLVCVAQLGGMWAPTRHLQPLRYCRLAALLDGLGWRAVADDLYAPALRWPDAAPAVLPRALNHAIAMHRAAADDPALRGSMLAQLRTRVPMLQRVAPSTISAYGLAYLAAAEGRPAEAAARAERLLDETHDIQVYDVLIAAELALGDAAPAASRETHWRRALRACRDRLAVQADDAYAWQVYARLSDLALRLREPLVAQANARLALADTNTPPAVAAQLRSRCMQPAATSAASALEIGH